MDKNRFLALWKRCADGNTAGGEAERIFVALERRYMESHRHYHTTNHIKYCLSSMDSAASDLGRSDAVELAVWFHDVIYEPGEGDNELKSADWFADLARDILPDALIEQVRDHILSTTHEHAPTDDGSKYVVDVDLSVFGQPTPEFMRDGDQIRQEFSHLSDAEYKKGQGQFLKKLLARERIFNTPWFYERYERRARKNIQKALAHYAA